MSRRPSWPASRSWRGPHWSAGSPVRSPCPSVRAPAGRRAGAALVGGLAREVAVLVGEAAGGALALDATIEVGRLARQVAKMPRAEAERAASGDPLECWRLDTKGWVGMPK